MAQLKPNCANVADKNLKRQGFRTFFPLVETTRKVQGRFVTSKRPVFPGYLFVSLDPERGLWRAINSTAGVTRLVEFGEGPASVPHDLVEQLMERCDAAGKLLSPQILKAGDRVEITSGPFASLVAEIEKIAPDRRIWVLMNVMGSKTRVSLGAEAVRTT